MPTCPILSCSWCAHWIRSMKTPNLLPCLRSPVKHAFNESQSEIKSFQQISMSYRLLCPDVLYRISHYIFLYLRVRDPKKPQELSAQETASQARYPGAGPAAWLRVKTLETFFWRSQSPYGKVSSYYLFVKGLYIILDAHRGTTPS